MSSLRSRVAVLEGILGGQAAAVNELASSLPGLLAAYPSISEEEIVAIWHRTVGKQTLHAETLCALHEDLWRASEESSEAGAD